MIKMVIAAVWTLTIGLSSLFAVVALTPDIEPTASEDKFFGGLDYIKTDIISVPVLANGKIDGYVIAQFVFTVEGKILKRLSVPPNLLIVDAAFSTLFSNKIIDFKDIKPVALDELKIRIRTNVNERFGSDLIYEVLVEQLNFIPMDQVRYGPRRQATTN